MGRGLVLQPSFQPFREVNLWAAELHFSHKYHLLCMGTELIFTRQV
uniref:Uncharacterized protein n=1 Tax=Picea sitchensis TaxID=3332 RepID=A9P027_PICSI|nr:unknown [Picea sitchensis]